MSDDKADSVRITAVTVLGELGSSSSRAIYSLVGALNSDSETVRQTASDALSKLGSSAVPALIAALKSPHLTVIRWHGRSFRAYWRWKSGCLDDTA
jgi:HEAT repeat protein